MTRVVHCPRCDVELTIPSEAGSRRLKCPQCAERFYPPGAKKTTEKPRPAEVPRPPKRDSTPIEPLPDLRDLMDVPFADEAPVPGRSRPAVADAASLLRDDAEIRRKKVGAEARAQARRCPDCRSLVLSGMSLCERCGLDLDTGLRVAPDESLVDDTPPVVVESGPPALVLVIGMLVLASGLILALLSIITFEGLGRLCLTAVSLFGAYAGAQFLRGHAFKLMIVALMLAGGVDLVALIILPVVQADYVTDDEIAAEDGSKPETTTAEDGSEIRVARKPVAERIDMNKLTLGVVIFLVIGVLLLVASSPGVRSYFERKHRYRDDGYIQAG